MRAPEYGVLLIIALDGIQNKISVCLISHLSPVGVERCSTERLLKAQVLFNDSRPSSFGDRGIL